MPSVLTSESGSALNRQDLEGAEPTRPGIHVVKPHGRLIARGEKTVIIKNRRFTRYSGVPIYVVQGSDVWALIDMKDPRSISLRDFGRLRQQHRMSELDRETRWPGTGKLYAYEFELVKAFDPPLKAVKTPKEAQTFMERVQIEPRKEVPTEKKGIAPDLDFEEKGFHPVRATTAAELMKASAVVWKELPSGQRAELRERLAALEHEQWMKWAKAVIDEVESDRQDRWRSFFVPYKELTEASKDDDREWADKILQLIDELLSDIVTP